MDGMDDALTLGREETQTKRSNTSIVDMWRYASNWEMTLPVRT